jgi:hypothetical protein
VFADEAHFLPLRTVQNGIIAMLNEGARVAMASTPARGASGIQQILNGVHEITGRPICKQVDFDFNCPACRKKQVENPAYMCVHRMHLRPHIQSIDMIYIARAAYGVDSDAFRAEMMGSAIIRNHNFIAPEDIAQLRDNDRSVVATEDMMRNPPHFVFVSIDPSGSTRSKVDGETSDYAFVTAFVHQGSFVVIIFLLLTCYCVLGEKLATPRQSPQCTRRSRPTP